MCIRRRCPSREQGGFQSSWTGRNGGVSSDTSSHAMPGDRARPDSTKAQPRRFGTVSNPSIAHDNGAFPGHEATSSGQESFNRERRVENARGSSTGVTSQVAAITEPLACYVCLFTLPADRVPVASFPSILATCLAVLLIEDDRTRYCSFSPLLSTGNSAPDSPAQRRSGSSISRPISW